MDRYLPPALQADYQAVLAQVKAATRSEPELTTDDAAMKPLALVRTGADEAELRAASKALAARQRRDGGWGGNANLASGAYSTDVALYALAEAREPLSDQSPCARGAAWLVFNQQADGSWHVASRAPRFRPYFESGFPYAGDQWISNAGTAWTATGLAASLPEKQSRWPSS